eukprot:gene12532-18544_t
MRLSACEMDVGCYSPSPRDPRKRSRDSLAPFRRSRGPHTMQTPHILIILITMMPPRIISMLCTTMQTSY